MKPEFHLQAPHKRLALWGIQAKTAQVL